LVALVFTAAGKGGTRVASMLSVAVTVFAMLIASTRLLKRD
jgi:hypothetical protein